MEPRTPTCDLQDRRNAWETDRPTTGDDVGEKPVLYPRSQGGNIREENASKRGA